MILSFWLTIAHQEKINLGRIYVFDSSQSELRLPLLQVVSSNKYFSVGVQSPTEINAIPMVLLNGEMQILKRRISAPIRHKLHYDRVMFAKLFVVHTGR